MKLVSIGLSAVLVITGCGGRGDAQSPNSSASAQLFAKTANKNPPQIKASVNIEPRSASEADLGIDSNNNGLWDDVDQYIDARFSNPDKAKAMRQLAVAIQSALLQNDSIDQSQEATRVWFRALKCVRQTFGEAGYYEGKRLSAEMLNSELRSRAYALHSSSSGGFYEMPNGAVCDN